MEDDFYEIPDDVEDTLVPVVLARTPEEAEVYCELLHDHDVPAVVGDEDALDANGHPVQHGMTHGVPVLVPEAMLDEAGEIIASREDSEGLLAGDDEDGGDDYDDEDDHFGMSEVDDDDDDDDDLDGPDLLDDVDL